jgi:hypothetical protein
MKHTLNILLAGEIGVGKTTTLNVFPGDVVLELDDNFNEILQKQVILTDIEGYEKAILREIDLGELLKDFITYKALLDAIDIFFIFTNTNRQNLRDTREKLIKLKEKLPNSNFYIIANFQDKATFSVEKARNTLKYKTYEFSAIQEDSKQKFLGILKDISSILFQNKELESDAVQHIKVDELIWTEITKGRELEEKGDFFAAANIFSNVSSQLEKFGFNSQTDSEIVFYLCKAWESLEKSQEEKNIQFLEEAKKHFLMVKEKLDDSRLKLLISANIIFCEILKHAFEFDKQNESERDMRHIPEIKKLIEEVTMIYQEGGFHEEEQWTQNVLLSLDELISKK